MKSRIIFSALVLVAPRLRAADSIPLEATANQLEAINVTSDRYQPSGSPPPSRPKRLLLGFGLPAWPTLPTRLDAVVVTATRTPQKPEHVAASVRIFDEPSLRTSPAATLDGVFRSVPGFSLFRRGDSLTANPTAQGVSLRGLGPSGASRSLVLLDGVPLNDPFGGWVAWTKVPREGLARAEIVPGGGATAWGNAALGGVIQLLVEPPRTRLAIIDEPPQPLRTEWHGTLGLNATVGDFGTRSGEIVLTRPVGRGIVQVFARDFATDGFSLIAPERRGLIDIPAWSKHRWLMLRWRHPLGKNLELTATARGYEENRGNGTPYQGNDSREKFLSLALAAQPKDHFAWNAVAYAQDQSFASTFSSVNATRTGETPASDQFAVPAVAFGGAWTGMWRHASGARTSGSGDARTVRGETRENFAFANGAFTRQRIAGGNQFVAGVFALHEHPLASDLRLTLGARLDAWRDTDGRRNEVDRVTGAALRDDRYADQSGTQLSPSVGLVWTPVKAWRVRANAQQAFRRPTLNELYRPFRQGPNVTEANPALEIEQVTTGEIGLEWTMFHESLPSSRAASNMAEKRPRLVLSATGFWNELRDAVGNVTIARGPGTFPIVGFVAAGGVGRQRLNLDRTRIRGLELAARLTPAETFTLDAAALLNDATVRRAAIAPGLVGKRVAQVPNYSATTGFTWRVPAKITFSPRLRWIGRQFEDDENTLRLGETVIVDLGVSRPLTTHSELFLHIENIGNTRVETGRTSDGIVNLGTPRFAFGGIRLTW